MRKLYAFILFASICTLANAQHYYTLPDSKVHWEQWWGSIGMSGYRYYSTDTVNSDTIINTVTYTKIFDGTHVYQGSYRSDTTGKMYYSFSASLQENLVMDISKNAGDSLKNI